MNKKVLKGKLLKENIPEDLYSLEGGLPNEAYCLNQNRDIWEVYYSERGKKTELKTFTSEDEACVYFYHFLTEMMKDLKNQS